MAEAEPSVAYVWAWLPGRAEPLPMARLDGAGPVTTFTYGRGYLDRSDAIPVYAPELPLQPGPQSPELGPIASCIEDSGPDAWGMRVIEHRRGQNSTGEVGLLTYLLESSSDRIGGLDFQTSPNDYRPRGLTTATLEDLAEAARRVDDGLPLAPELDAALLHGTSAGGARPKALLSTDQGPAIAKFSSSGDVFPFVRAECLTMTLAATAGLEVAPVQLEHALGKDVLVVGRFDRPAPGERRLMVSARTILRLGPLGVGASYADLADEIRRRFVEPERTLRELFSRVSFNVLVGNTDDHAKNHAAFWDGSELTLTPAYDVCPQPRTGGVATQAMAIGPDGDRLSQVAGCVRHAATYQLSESDARDIIDAQIAVIRDNWTTACDAARVTEQERLALWESQFLNSFALEDY